MEQYVCAFRGRRDYYQAPLALAEKDMLDQFITDAYAGSWFRRVSGCLPKRAREKVRFRHDPGIPDERVKCLWKTTFVEHLRHRLGCSPSVTYAKLDQHFSRAAAGRARRTRSHLFLYSPYAWEAFTTTYRHDPQRVLFQYHPHPEFEARILAKDHERHPLATGSFEEESGAFLSEPLRRRSRDCWRHADVIFCASTFTRRSLLEAGADERKCRIVPYGIDLPQQEVVFVPETFQALFVGSGGQRKGLHHLLLAWRKANLPASSRLTLVCRVIEPEIESLAREVPRVELVRGASAEELNTFYTRSSVFIMPSLVEGFGQVYLEAMAQGCPVLGTANTCLPDLGGEGDGVFLVIPGNIDQLAALLEWLSRTLPNDSKIRYAARTCAGQFTWQRFRENLRAGL